ncbi:chemotaxis protein CheW [Spirulina subsalsa FACHB-351]|uniref:Chemotaxis protein CheW n=1 Tax=Spirulina subsalsa FACHB-351 TaxID=234711 RepID=A0ABT3L9S9_9CYAN|nr:chemotaxis protein CheW [Spirulina subsalsa]MCW6038256.1 chemotaxis protein CheW [Spirulina subsalsa FACHB-351]
MIGNPHFLTGQGDDISPDIEKLETPEGELHLRFFLPSGIELALPATGIKEVMNQPPDRITPIPNASPLLLGTLNLRGQVIWVADLGQFLGDPVALNTQRAEIPVIAVEDQEIILGLAIDQIGEMGWLPSDQIQAPNNVPDTMTSFILGEWVTKGDPEQCVRLLDQVKILRSARWAT